MKMNKVLTVFFAMLFLSLGAFAQDADGDGNEDAAIAVVEGAEIEFKVEKHNFGEIDQNKPVTYAFVFTNTGNEPLILTNVKPSCGCTTPDWSKEPIMPGESSEIKATYNAARAGKFNKAITVTSNGNSPTKILFIKGFVVTEKDGTPEKEKPMMTAPKEQ